MSDTVSISAPEGSRWIFEEVATDRGRKSLGNVPLLEWTDINGCVAHYTVEGILAALDGASLRVSYQGIARRMAAAGKSQDEIAQAIVDFRPGRRSVGSATPVSRARKAAASAAEVVSGDSIAALLARVASGSIKLDESGNVVSS